MKKKQLSDLENKLPKKTFKASKHKENQESCCICVEDFTADSVIRETPCDHIFHDHCLMDWVKTKLNEPDCPFCRTAIQMQPP